MPHLPFYVGGLALAGVVLIHYAIFGAQLGVSGRISTLVNRARNRTTSEPALSEADALAALLAMTESEFGADAVNDAATDSAPVAASSRAATTEATSTTSHLLFFAGLAIGGFIAAQSFGAFAPTPTLSGELFARYLGSSLYAGQIALFGGGLLVGFGTRMSGGCTSGHGLVGVPFLQPGSLLSTAGFFGAGIAVSLAMEVLR